MQTRNFRRNAVALALAAAFATGAVVADRVVLHANAASPLAVAPTPTQSSTATPVAALPDFSGLVEKYGPAVVNISVVQNRKAVSRNPRIQTPEDEDIPPMFKNLPFPFQLPEP